jgi:hypothetical protein
MSRVPCASSLWVLVVLGLLPGCGSSPPPPAAEAPPSPAKAEAPTVSPAPSAVLPNPPAAPQTPSVIGKKRSLKDTSSGPPRLPAELLAQATEVERQVDEALRPAEHALPLRPDKRKLLAGPQALEQPELPAPPPTSSLPRPQPPLRRPEVVASALPEEVPLQLSQALPPPRLLLPVQPLARAPAPDPNQVPPLPPLARPAPDSDFSDPLADYDRDYLQTAPAPQRTEPLPFDRPSVPDPFAHRRAVQLEAPPAETPLPPQLLPRRPARPQLPGS